MMQADERMRAAMGRLTANEKECLRRRLLPQTAKEMAVDLGISPHAVEKRLKMARAKLGVSSSLAAARFLAETEQYQALGPQGPDLPAAAEPKQGGGVAAPLTQTRTRRSLVQGLPMIASLCLILLAAQDAPTPPAPPAGAPRVQRLEDIATRKVDMNEAAAFNSEAFHNQDKDGSGFLEPRELSALEPRDQSRDATLPPAPPAGAPDPGAERKWLRKMDTDRDSRVSESEYIDYMTPWTLWQGVPAFWHPKP